MDSFVERRSNPFLRYPDVFSQPVDAQICGEPDFRVFAEVAAIDKHYGVSQDLTNRSAVRSSESSTVGPDTGRLR